MYRLINPKFDFVKKISDIEFTFNCGKPRLLLLVAMALPDLIRLSGQKKAAFEAAFFGGCGWDVLRIFSYCFNTQRPPTASTSLLIAARLPPRLSLVLKPAPFAGSI